MTTKHTDLRARALAAASAARFSGFHETAEALIELARECELERHLAKTSTGHAAFREWLTRKPLQQSVTE